MRPGARPHRHVLDRLAARGRRGNERDDSADDEAVDDRVRQAGGIDVDRRRVDHDPARPREVGRPRQCRLGIDEVRRAGRQPRGVEPRCRREQRARAGPVEARIAVRRVVGRGPAGRSDDLRQFRLAHAEKRADQGDAAAEVAARPDAGKAGRSRPAGEAKQKGLGRVVGVMRRREPRDTVVGAPVGHQGIARRPRRRLEIGRGVRTGPDQRRVRDAERCGIPGDRRCFGRSLGPQAMVDGQCADAVAERGVGKDEEGEAVGPPRHRDGQRFAAAEWPADECGEGLDQRSASGRPRDHCERTPVAVGIEPARPADMVRCTLQPPRHRTTGRLAGGTARRPGHPPHFASSRAFPACVLIAGVSFAP